MEGKAVLFKKFADLDSFDLEARLSAAVGVRMHIRISTMTLRVVVAAHIVCMQRLPSL
jgi:malic enzyme